MTDPSAPRVSRTAAVCLALAGALALSVGATDRAWAWGGSGHRMIGQLGAEALPDTLPAFLRKPGVAADIGELAREPDRWRQAGRVHDNFRDPGHYVDVDDQGKVAGGPALSALPATRAEYEAALQAAGSTGWRAGWLPYTIIDGQQQLAKDFAYWRADRYGERVAADRAHKAWLVADRRRREAQIIIDLGVWSHYVGDATQPLHVSVHHDGWGDYPNPNGFTQAHIHVPLEGPYVAQTVTAQAVRADMTPYRDCRCAIEQRVAQYLANSARYVEPLYQLEKAGGFAQGDPRGPAFMAARIAEAADELRDLVIEAWSASDRQSVGYPAMPLADVEAGKAGDAYALLHGKD